MAITISDMLPGTLNCFQNVAKVKKGEKVLILVDTTVDKDVVEAYRIGAELVGGDVSVLTVKAPVVGGDPALVVEELFLAKWPEVAWSAMKGADVTLHLCGFTECHGIFGKCAAAFGLKSIADLRKVYNIRLVRSEIFSKEALASDWATYPQPLFEYLGIKAHEQVQKIAGNLDTAEVRVTDPQGTDISFAGFGLPSRWQAEKQLPPFDVFGGAMVILLPDKPEPNAEGVIVSTSLHTGPIAPMRITVKGGRGVSIEGGGEAGKLWARMWEEGKNASSRGRVMVGDHQPGVNWLEECAIGLHPKTFRLEKYRYEGGLGWQSWVGGSRRSGVTHFGFGGGVEEYYSHRDVEIFHPTLTINKTTIVENGRLKLFDEPAIRKEAAKYGDPDELLREHWIPALQTRYPE